MKNFDNYSDSFKAYLDKEFSLYIENLSNDSFLASSNICRILEDGLYLIYDKVLSSIEYLYKRDKKVMLEYYVGIMISNSDILLDKRCVKYVCKKRYKDFCDVGETVYILEENGCIVKDPFSLIDNILIRCHYIETNKVYMNHNKLSDFKKNVIDKHFINYRSYKISEIKNILNKNK